MSLCVIIYDTKKTDVMKRKRYIKQHHHKITERLHKRFSGDITKLDDNDVEKLSKNVILYHLVNVNMIL